MLALIMPACRTAPQAPEHRPEWIAQPKTEDSIYFYCLGHAADQPSEARTREAALDDARRRIAKTFPVPPDATPDQSPVLQKVELVPECFYVIRRGATYEGWVQVSYPLAEKQRVLRQIEHGAHLNQSWGNAQALLGQGQFAAAQELLQTILADTQPALFINFKTEEPLLALADALHGRNNIPEARRRYESVLRTTTDTGFKNRAAESLRRLPEAPRAWPLNDRWQGRKVALLCAIRDENACRRFPDLINALTRDLGAAQLEIVDITTGFDAAALANAFDCADFRAACKTAVTQTAGVILAILLDIDPKQRGVTTKNFGVEMPVPDSVARFFVLRAGDGKLVYNGQYKEVSGWKPEINLAERAATLIITRYLAPQAPSLDQ